jgi:anthranilate phosphoribosyltransferase
MSRSLHYVLLAVLLVPVAFGCGRALLPAYADGDDATTSAACGDADANARIVHAVLAGQPGPIRDAVLLNAAAAVVAATPADAALIDQLDAALTRCAKAIDSGTAALRCVD